MLTQKDGYVWSKKLGCEGEAQPATVSDNLCSASSQPLMAERIIPEVGITCYACLLSLVSQYGMAPCAIDGKAEGSRTIGVKLPESGDPTNQCTLNQRTEAL
jgi:hypothetical protein